MIALILETIFAFIILCILGGMNSRVPIVTPVLPWVLLLCAEYLLEVRYLKKERSQNAFIGLNVVYFVVNTTFLLTIAILGRSVEALAIYGIFGIWGFAFIIFASMILCIRLPKLILEEMTDQKMISHFEITMLLAIVYFTLMDADISLPVSGVICMVGAPILNFFTLTAMRSGKRGRGAARNLLTSPGVYVSGGLFAILLVWSTLARDSFARASSNTIGAGKSALFFAFAKIEQFMEWLVQFLPKDEMAIEMEGGSEIAMSQAAEASEEIDLSGLLPYVAGAMAILVLIVLIRALWATRKDRRKAVVMRDFKAQNDEERTRGKLWKKLRQAVRFELFYLKNRRTSLGIYIWLTRFGKRHGYPMAEGQTAREYLEGFEAHGVQTSLLIRLAEGVDRSLYSRSPGKLTEMEGADEFRKEVARTFS